MIAVLRKIGAFFLWIVSSEELPPERAATLSDSDSLEFRRWLFTREQLEEHDPRPSEGSTSRSFFSWLLEREELAVDTGPAPWSDPSFAHWLLSREPLDSPADVVDDGQTDAGVVHRHTLLRWLCSSEELDRITGDTSADTHPRTGT